MKSTTLTQVTITGNRQIAPDAFVLSLSAPHIAKRSHPGNFLLIRVGQSSSPLLRRPFSILSADGQDCIEVMYKVVGPATRLLSQTRPEDHIDLIGSIGNCFTENEGKRPVLVGGGCGIPPVVFLAETLKKQGLSFTFILGAKTEDELYLRERVESLCEDLICVTEDGSRGTKGTVLDYLAPIDLNGSALYVCGPMGMIKALSVFLGDSEVPCQVSVEEYMACGVGACQGCVIKTRDGFKRVCKDGPVFDIRYLDFDNVL